MMNKKHENISSPNLFYCFVNISKDTSVFKFYIVPSSIVAKYVKDEHALWLNEKKKEGKNVKDKFPEGIGYVTVIPPEPVQPTK